MTETLKSSQHIAIYSLIDTGPPTRTLQPHVPHEVDHKSPILAYPNFMPDGNILFMAASNGKHGFDYDIYRLDLRTSSLESLTEGIGYATDLKVSGDGNTAVFLKWRKNRPGDLIGNQVYLLDVPTRGLKRLEITGLN